MILIDFSAVAVAAALLSPDVDVVRHITLNIIRSARAKFHGTYGEVVVCCDSPHTWRREIFPHYKAGRKKSRAESQTDWHRLLDIVAALETEIQQNFPYKVLRVETAEADDIIATLVINRPGEHIIISNDKDFMQLGTAMYSPIRKEILLADDPEKFLTEHIILGDMSDGIPNVLSAADTFVSGKRQKIIRRLKLEEWLTLPPEQCFNEEQMVRFHQNRSLISLYDIPDQLQQTILCHYDSIAPIGKRGPPLVKYMQTHKLRNLLQKIEDF